MEYYICKLKSGCIGLNILSSDQEIFLGLQPRTSLGPREISWASGNLLVARDVHCTTQYIPPLDSLRIQYWAIMRIFVLGVGDGWVGQKIFSESSSPSSVYWIPFFQVKLSSLLKARAGLHPVASWRWKTTSCQKNIKSFRFLKPSTSC